MRPDMLLKLVIARRPRSEERHCNDFSLLSSKEKRSGRAPASSVVLVFADRRVAGHDVCWAAPLWQVESSTGLHQPEFQIPEQTAKNSPVSPGMQSKP